jgi:hypothetical protein
MHHVLHTHVQSARQGVSSALLLSLALLRVPRSPCTPPCRVGMADCCGVPGRRAGCFDNKSSAGCPPDLSLSLLKFAPGACRGLVCTNPCWTCPRSSAASCRRWPSSSWTAMTQQVPLPQQLLLRDAGHGGELCLVVGPVGPVGESPSWPLSTSCRWQPQQHSVQCWSLITGGPWPAALTSLLSITREARFALLPSPAC